MKGGENSSSFSVGKSAQEKGLSYVPEAYEAPTSLPSPNTANVPVVDMEELRKGSVHRSRTIQLLRDACRRKGIFLIVNHGIYQSVMDDALSAASEFFNLPTKDKIKFASSDVHRPVRYSTSIKDGVEETQFRRNFLKHYSHPLEDWIHMWPRKPPAYREKMGRYCKEVRELCLEIMAAITESLGLGSSYLSDKMENGMQVMAVNCYPPCPEPEIALGLPPHSDHSCLTILNQSFCGLEIMDKEEGEWRTVPALDGILQVLLGDHLEVLSNGLYESVIHSSTLNSERTRISLASLHSLGMEEKMETAKELVNKNNPKKYRESSFKDFLNFLMTNGSAEGKSFISTLKIDDKN